MSASSTPKRPKTVWKVLLRNVDTSLVPDSVNLEQLLSDTEDADTFAHTSERTQRFVLDGLLGEGMSELVNSIIQSVKLSLCSPVSLVDRIMSYDLAPSKIKENELFEVASCIIDAQPGFLAPAKETLVTAVFGEKYKQPDSQPDLTKYDGTLKTITDLTNRHRKRTINIHIEEAAGYTMLGNYAVHFSEILSEELSKVMMYWNQMMTANNKKRGQNPTSDTAIIMLLQSSATPLDPKKIPVVVYEYKPVVHPDPEGVNHYDLMEALLQASYCLRFYNVSQMIHCLTDLSTWHYFKVKRITSDKLKIEWWHLIHHTFPLNTKIVTEHAGFLTTEVKKLIDH